MIILNTCQEIKKIINNLKKQNKSIGFVPTMGALHEGHLSLIKEAQKENDITIVSIFINPTQFGKNEDFQKYPKPWEEDQKILIDLKIDFLFLPNAQEIYGKDINSSTIIYEPKHAKKLCGKTRINHFQGVTSVVLRLFNLIKPNKAYFGEKDFQQLVIIKKMVEDLFLDTEIIACPIIRDKNGLALSSRNKYLNEKEKKFAPYIYKVLKLVRVLFKKGENNTNELIKKTSKYLKKNSPIKIEYFKIIDPYTLDEQPIAEKNDRIMFAGYLGKTRLIDNLKL